MFDTLISKLVGLQQAANQVDQTETINLLASTKNSEVIQPAIKEDARQIFDLLKTVIASVDPQIAQKLTSVDDLS